MPVKMQLATKKKRRNGLPKTGSGALTCSLQTSQRTKQRRHVRAGLDEPSIQVLSRNNLPLTLALHTDQIGKDHIHHTGLVHKTLIQSAPKRLDTRHNKHVIEQWDFQHNRGVPYPEIPLPITLKRSGDAKQFWKSLKVHNEIIRKAKKTVDSYLPQHVIKMRERKERNRNIILKNHQRGLKKEKRKKLLRRRNNVSGTKVSATSNATTAFVNKHQLKASSAQQLRDWSFREKVVETTLEMYAPKQLLRLSKSATQHDNASLRSGISLDRAPVNEPFLKQQGPAGLSINYLRSTLTPSPGVNLHNRPKTTTRAHAKKLTATSSSVRSRNGEQSKTNRRPQSAQRRRRTKTPTGGNGNGQRRSRPRSANAPRRSNTVGGHRHPVFRKANVRSNNDVDFLRDEETDEWIGMKRAAKRAGVESNQKHVTLQHDLMNTTLDDTKLENRVTFASLGKSGDMLVGEHLEVFWRDPDGASDAWYRGVVKKYRTSDDRHFIWFEDGDSDWYNVEEIKYRICT